MVKGGSRRDLAGAIFSDLKDRVTWDSRQSMFYRMRHNGLRRKSKPWPGASDAHFPLSDTIIEKLKPYFFQQLFATDQVAQFTPIKGDALVYATGSAQWFDYQLKQKSNLEKEILAAIDSMLTGGRGVMKVFWGDKGSSYKGDGMGLVYQSIDPQHIIVPAWTTKLEDADRIVHVQNYSQEGYRRNKLFKQGDEFIRRITGEGDSKKGDLEKRQDMYRREGLTFNQDDSICVWETWTRDEKGKWWCETFSPLEPEVDIREPYQLPYKHGMPPFCAFEYEVKDQRWYSPRGVCEMVAVHEAELCKLMNEKNDYMTMVNRPLFRSAREIPNAANLKFNPGQILPFDIQPVQMPQPPISFDQSLVQVRDLAEQRVATPDFGLSQTFSVQERRTATEINAIGQMFHQSSDLRLRVFRMGLNQLYRMSWDLLVQYAADDLNYWFVDDAGELDVDALREEYDIKPSGSADGVNRAFIYQRALNRFQMMAGDPFIDQGELRKSILEADDVALVKRLYRDPELKMADQAEDQANEITFLRLGFPAVVKPTDDHATHIRTIMGYMQMSAQTNRQLEAMEMQRLQEHIQSHLQLLREQDSKAAKAIEAELQELSAAARRAQQPPDAPGGLGVDAGNEVMSGEVLSAA